MQNTDNQSFVTSSCILSSRPSRKVICISKSLFLFPMEPNAVWANIGNKKKYKGACLHFSIFTEGLLGLCKSCFAGFAKRSLGEHWKQKKHKGASLHFSIFSEDLLVPLTPSTRFLVPNGPAIGLNTIPKFFGIVIGELGPKE